MWTVELNVFIGDSSRVHVALELRDAVGVRAGVAVWRKLSKRDSFGGRAGLQLRWVASNNCLERSRGPRLR